MIYLVVSVRVKEGKLAEFLHLFNENAVTVRQEKGCVEYLATVDAQTGLPPQVVDKDRVVVLEKWESPEALKDHHATPHMTAFFKSERGLTEGSSIMVLKEP
jgi:quinol monooxygenase YgiN